MQMNNSNDAPPMALIFDLKSEQAFSKFVCAPINSFALNLLPFGSFKNTDSIASQSHPIGFATF